MDSLRNTLPSLIDHTLLKQDALPEDIERLCHEAREYHIHSVCVNPIWVSLASRLLADTDVVVCTVCGFPLGANLSEFKGMEAAKAVIDGAREIDMVANIGWLLAGEWSAAESEISQVRELLPDSVILKVIIESAKLSGEQITHAVETCISAGADFAKSSTGFFGGVTVNHIKTMKTTAGERIKIKAAGGIKTVQNCRDLLSAGADRLGCSASVGILQALETGDDS